MLISLVLAAILLAIVARTQMFSFVAQKPQDYAETAPDFDPKRVLNGTIASDGVIYGPTGRVVSRFVMRMEARWDGHVGTIGEHFEYESGRTQYREWQLTLGNDGRMTATAEDVVGTGEGIVSGSALNLNYRIRLPEDAGGHELDVTDWLYLLPNGNILNRSQMRRAGVTLAELVASLRPEKALP